MTFAATRTSEHPWTQSLIYQEEQLGFTGDFSYFQPKSEFSCPATDLVVIVGFNFWSQ